MSYTRPAADAVNFTFSGASAYTRPVADAVNFTFQEAVTGTLAATIDITASFAGAHGVSGVLDVGIDIAAAFSGSVSAPSTTAMKLSNALDADGFRLKNLADPTDDQDALTAMALPPYELGNGKVFRVPADTLTLFSMPIQFSGSSCIALDGAMVEVH